MEKAIIHIEGMSCEHCENAVQEAVLRLPGVKAVKADKDQRQAAVEYDPGAVNLAAMVDAIRDIGFDAT